MQVHSSNSAFSLVELSIVLVILGLLVGGILAGKSLIKASGLRATVNQIDSYRTAAYSFRDKYFALPGDLTNAMTIWPTDCVDVAGGHTCNGNGDGVYSGMEIYRYWHHLALAELVAMSRTYSGQSVVMGVTLPYTKVGDTTYIGVMTVPNANTLRWMGQGAGGNGPALIAEDAWNIDTKHDDGKPATGRVTSGTGSGSVGSCTSGTNYDLTDSRVTCATYFAF